MKTTFYMILTTCLLLALSIFLGTTPTQQPTQNTVFIHGLRQADLSSAQSARLTPLGRTRTTANIKLVRVLIINLNNPIGENSSCNAHS